MNRQDKAGSRPWLIALPTVGLVLLAVGWSGFWYFSASKAQASLDEWRSREANLRLTPIILQLRQVHEVTA